jgi:hypothetical protein
MNIHSHKQIGTQTLCMYAATYMIMNCVMRANEAKLATQCGEVTVRRMLWRSPNHSRTRPHILARTLNGAGAVDAERPKQIGEEAKVEVEAHDDAADDEVAGVDKVACAEEYASVRASAAEIAWRSASTENTSPTGKKRQKNMSTRCRMSPE